MKNYTYPLILIVLMLTSKVYAQTITELGFFSPLVSTFEGKYYNDHLFITQQGLKVFDVSNPLNPTLSGQASYPGSYAYQIELNGNRVYLGEGGGGYFSVYDISNINSPSLSGSTLIPSSSFLTGGDLMIKGTTAYMSGGDSLYVIDVSDPVAPVYSTSLRVSFTSFGSASALATDSTLLFLLTTSGISVFDISTALSPVFIDSIPLTHAYHTGLAIDTINHRLFSPWLSALQSFEGYDAYQISSGLPAYQFSDSTSFGGGEFGVTDYYNDVLLISAGGGVNAFNVSPSAHQFLTSFSGQNVPNSVVSLEFRDSVFYNIRRGGFEILRLNNGFTTNISTIDKTDFSIYPNPASTLLYIQLNKKLTDSQSCKFEIITLTGEKVFEEIINSRTATMNLNLIPGIYFVRISGDEFTLNKKLIVQ
jgi:hypothetical protein